jgi:hypothetical protein
VVPVSAEGISKMSLSGFCGLSMSLCRSRANSIRCFGESKDTTRRAIGPRISFPP